MQCNAVWCRQACGSRKEWWAAPDPGGLATATPACGPPCANRPRGFTCDPRCSTQSIKGIRRRGMVSPAVKPHTAWATDPFWPTSRDPPRVAGLEGTQPRKGGDRRGVVDAGAGTTASARRRYAAGGRVPSLVRRRASLCARTCAWVRTRVEVSDSGLGPALAVNRRRGGDHGVAQAGAMGGGGQGNRSRAQTRVCGSSGRWRGVHSPTKRTTLPSLRPRARSKLPRRGHGGAVDRNATSRVGTRKGAKGPASPSGLGCARAGVHACARATCPRGRARERERAGVGSHRRPGQCSTRRPGG
jgi:hypothetical protein